MKIKLTAALTALLVLWTPQAYAAQPSKEVSVHAQKRVTELPAPKTTLRYTRERHPWIAVGGFVGYLAVAGFSIWLGNGWGRLQERETKLTVLSALPLVGPSFAFNADPSSKAMGIFSGVLMGLLQTASIAAIVYGIVGDKKTILSPKEGLSIVPTVGKINGGAVAYTW